MFELIEKISGICYYASIIIQKSVQEVNKMDMGKIKINSCQYCGGTDFRYGCQSGNSRMGGAPGFLDNQEPIHHLICADCGAVVFSWLTNPRKYPRDVPENSF